MKEKNSRDDYSFINEKIKEKTVHKKTIAIMALAIFAFFIFTAIIAALVFVKMVHVAGGSFNVANNSKIEIPKDVLPEEIEEDDGEENQKTEEELVIYEKEFTPEEVLEHYDEVCREMVSVVDDQQASFVHIVGVESGLDALNESYETTQEVKGVIVAENALSYFVLATSDSLKGASTLNVYFTDEIVAAGTVVKSDKETGLLVVNVSKSKIPASYRSTLTCATLGNSYQLHRGQPIILTGELAGNNDSIAFGNIASLENTFSCYDKQFRLFATDVQMNDNGNGFVLDLKGRIIGIITKKINGDGSNTYMALGISEVKPLVEKMSNGETESYLGIKAMDITEQLSKQSDIPEGLLVKNVQDDSPAMLAGILPMDIITAIDDTSVTTYTAYRSWMNTAKSGDVVVVYALRVGAEGYEPIEFEVTVKEK